MKVHGGTCRPNGGPTPCSGEHLYYCAWCGAPFKTSANTLCQDQLTGRVYASPSYPACNPHDLSMLETQRGYPGRPRQMGQPGVANFPIAPLEPEMPNASDVPEGA